MQQAAFAATTMEQQAATLNAREQTLRDGARRLARPAAGRAERPSGHGHGHPAHHLIAFNSPGSPTARSSASPRRPPARTPCGCCPARPRSPSRPRPRPERGHRPARRPAAEGGGHHGGAAAAGPPGPARHGPRLTRSGCSTQQDGPTRHSSHTHHRHHTTQPRPRETQCPATASAARPPGPPRPS